MKDKIKELEIKLHENEIITLKELEEYCRSIYNEMDKLRVDFEKDTLNDSKLCEHFEQINSKHSFSSIMVAGSILAGIELRNMWRDNGKLEGKKEIFPYSEKQINMIDRYHELQDVLDKVEWYIQMNSFEDEEEYE